MFTPVFVVFLHAIFNFVRPILVATKNLGRRVRYCGREDIAIAADYIWFYILMFCVWLLCIVSGERMEIRYLCPQLPRLLTLPCSCQFSVHIVSILTTMTANRIHASRAQPFYSHSSLDGSTCLVFISFNGEHLKISCGLPRISRFLEEIRFTIWR